MRCWAALRMVDETLVFVMRADPEPDDVVALENAECPVMEADANGIVGAGRMNRLEAETRMIGIGTEEFIRVLSLRANLGGGTRVLCGRPR